MKNSFLGYYRPDESGFQVLWNECLFVLDANTLLNFYRYSPQTNKTFFSVFDKIANRLWVPHQAAFEYQDNRTTEIIRQENVYGEIRKQLDNTENELGGLLKKGHLSIDAPKLLRKINSTFSEIKDQLNEHKKQHPNLLTDDTIRDKLTSLLDQRVGVPYTQEQLDEKYKLGEKRYLEGIPPGFKDKDKKDIKRFGDLLIQSKYGDLILWFQILEKAKDAQKPIIFITDDTKEDWWWEKAGRTIGPRTELVKEIKEFAGVTFYMYTPTEFLEYAKGRFDITIKQSTIDEVRDITEAKLDWKSEVINAFHALGGQADLTELYEYIEQHTARLLPDSWQTIIRRTVYNHSSDVEAYLGGDDLFTRLGKGRWGLREIIEPLSVQINDVKGSF